MSEYFFSVLGEYQSLKGGKKTAAKRNRIAREIGGKGSGYIYYYDDALRRYRGWGYTPNAGGLLGAATAKAVIDAWQKAGVGSQVVK